MKIKISVLAISSVLFLSSKSWADYHFNPSFINQNNHSEPVADLSAFEKGDSIPAGIHSTDIYINSTPSAKRKIDFKKDRNGNSIPTFTLSDLQSLGINTDILPTETLKFLMSVPSHAIDIKHISTESSETFDVSTQKLDLHIPQIYIKSEARGSIPPEAWQEGINALLLSYSLTGSKDSYDQGEKKRSNFLSLQSGLNLGAWRLRDSSSWSYSSSNTEESNSDWQHISTFIERDIPILESELKVGDTSTSADMFDSVTFRGIQLVSDDNMLPDSQKGFAPVVKGIAQSNAKVTIRQNGYVLYQTYVPPGPFEINDLFPTSSSGDLDVTVDENNGSSHKYTVAFSSVPLMQREGHIEYEVDSGKLRSGNSNKDESDFFQTSIEWGSQYDITFYGGSQISSKYNAWVFGIGKNIGQLGALSVDITQANSTLADDSHHSGQSLRFLYAKSLDDFGTTFQLLGYRYSTSGFYTLDDTTYNMMSGYNSEDNDDDDDKNNEPDYQDYYNLYYTKKGKVQLSVNQHLNDIGELYITGSQQNYWHTDEKDIMFQGGFNTTLKGISYTLAYTYDKAPEQPTSDQRISFSISVPVSLFLPQDYSHSAYLTYSSNTDRHGDVTHSAGISGTLLEDNNLNYNIQQGYSTEDSNYSGSAHLNYKGTYNNLDLGYNYDADMKEVNYGISGGVVVHNGGITFSQPLGTTNVLVSAPDASDIEIENNAGVKTDWRGYAVVPYANTYRHNRIALNTRSLGHNIDLDNSVADVVPTEGALVEASFSTHVGARTMMTLTKNGTPLPFGAILERADGTSTIVGDEGLAYLSGLPQDGELNARWGNSRAERCNIHYHLSDKAMAQRVSYSTGVCQ